MTEQTTNTAFESFTLNCDMGEGLTPCPDETVMPLIDLANIACGGHAGDRDTMAKTVDLAGVHQVHIGAHPSYPDKKNFGRHSLSLSKAALQDTLYQQVSELEEIARQAGATLHHIKPHGALYLDMMHDPVIFEHILDFCVQFDPSLPLMLQGGVRDADYRRQAEVQGIRLLLEGFADRAYLPDGQLAPRSQPNSLYQNAEEIVAQSQAMMQARQVQTLCFHSDNPASVEALIALKRSAE
ncbi:MAG: 5-oxoprolinase subunit PxpA, partial [Hydrogenovibrio sp.]|nr:5-oxoprolinase subunit PxpA [Hydrogenovibrio sp.]